MPTAIIFPGQASQTPDMRERVAASRPDLLELAERIVGEDPFARVDESTSFAQPAIFCASLAGLAALEDVEAVAVAGHSLGELAALVAAEALTEQDALALVALRGRLMAGCREGTMLASLGGKAEEVREIAGRCGVSIANDNAPGQLVLSGERAAIQAATDELRSRGVRALELNVTGAFHSPLMADAVPEFAAALDATPVAEPRLPVYSCVTAEPMAGAPDEIRRRLADGLTQPVRWRETVEAMHAAGIDRFVEAGPGTVLTKLIRRTLPKELVNA